MKFYGIMHKIRGEEMLYGLQLKKLFIFHSLNNIKKIMVKLIIKY